VEMGKAIGMTIEHSPQLLVYRDGPVAYARVLGPVNRETAGFFEQRLEGVLRDPCITLALDLGAADYVDSDGIRWLQRLQPDLAAREIRFRLAVREGSRIERTLNLLQLDRTLSIEHYPADSTEWMPAAAV
jgi:anti-anti-sigma regulatory factor